MAPHPTQQTAISLSDINVTNNDNTGEDSPPDGGYGWVCVGACFTINCFTWGTVSVSLLFYLTRMRKNTELGLPAQRCAALCR